MTERTDGTHIAPEQIYRNGDWTTVIKPEGRYDILYSNDHYSRQTLPEGFPTASAVFIETAAANFLKEPQVSFRTETSELFLEAVNNHADIYLGDPSPTFGKFSRMGESAIVGTQVFAAYLLSVSIMKDKLSRRDALKLLAKGAALSWLVLPSASGLSLLVARPSEFTAELNKLSYNLHPEQNITVKLRNVIVAHKLEWIMQNLSRDPQISTLIGDGHVQMEDELISSGQKRLEYLSGLKPLIEVLFDRETVYKVSRVTFEGGRYKQNVSDVPDLKSLFV